MPVMRKSHPPLLAVAVALMFSALTSCSSPSADGSSDEARASESTARASSAKPSRPAPSPTGPCADGTCEIKVSVGDTVTVPPKYGLGPIKVVAITGGKVEMTAPLTGTGYSVSGCSGGGGVSSQGGGGVSLSCSEGPAATINDAMKLKVAEVLDASAALRIEPAG